MTESIPTANGATPQITGVFQNITRRQSSHTFGWANCWSENLCVPINHDNEPLDEIYVEHGVNFGGRINLIGGFSEKHEQRILNAVQSKIVWSLDIDMPDYAGMLGHRKDVPQYIVPLIYEWQSKAKTLRSIDLQLDWLTIGDSHAAAFAPFNSMIIRENGRTLYGQVTSDFGYVREYLEECPQIRGITMVFGSVDLRHHICRLDADWQMMLQRWKKFGDALNIEVEYALPFPVEFEGRRLPKTGYYKGRPFYGTQEERAEVLEGMWGYAGEIGMNVVRYPTEWLSMDPEVYAKERMERPQSVHLSPQYYRRHCEWPVYNLA